ncbi:MAG: glycosyltransferase involved in cell wall biosynthesis [Moritella sp.]|jgi:glycosyltransferase involved in cell wall biosynthesis
MIKLQQAIQNIYGTSHIINHHDEITEPEVSIIIPTKNCLKFLPTAIKSIQNQMIDDIEIVIIDDNSTDDSWKYLTLAASCDKRIRPFKMINGGGVAKVRNYGLDKAAGKYIAFLDADDYWLPRKLSKQLAFHKKHPEVTLSFCNYVHFNENNQSTGDCFDYWPLFKKYINQSKKVGYQVIIKQGAAMIYAENIIGTSSVLLNTAVITSQLKFDENLTSAEDWDLWLKIALSGPIGFTTSVGLAYLMRANSESENVKLRLLQVQKIMQRYAKDIFNIKPFALTQCTARLFVGYAEYYRNTSFSHQQSTLKFNNVLQSCCCHSIAFLLSPSIRVLKAILSDVKNLAQPSKSWLTEIRPLFKR